MKNLYLILFLLAFTQSTMAQAVWQEHLSHDRRAYSHLGHFVVDGEIVLVMGNERKPMNTLETIKGNSKKDQNIIASSFTFESKTTTTGLGSKEVLLIHPFDYDIPGYGAFSIHENNNVFSIQDIQGNPDPYEDDLLFISDAHLLGAPLEPKECIAENKRYILDQNDFIISEFDLTSSFAYHQGLNGETYQISDGIFSRLPLPSNGSIELGNYSMLRNNPFSNQLVKFNGATLTSYAYEDLSFVSEDLLEHQAMDIQFVENGFYYLSESIDSYNVYFYSNNGSGSELFYELPLSNEIIDFRIRAFEVIGDDIYFIGLLNSPLLKERFSYVQKRTLNKDFLPNRKDLELTMATATRDVYEEDGYIYTYKLTVTNLSVDPIDHFTIYTDELSEDFGPDQFKKFHVDQNIAPGESYEIDGEFTFNEWALNQITFNIVGVDYGIDSDESNNTFTADVVGLSNKETEIKEFSISPNLSSDFIKLKGNLEEIKSLVISNIKGNRSVISQKDQSTIDISSLPNGQYWLEIKTKTRKEQHPFMKI